MIMNRKAETAVDLIAVTWRDVSDCSQEQKLRISLEQEIGLIMYNYFDVI